MRSKHFRYVAAILLIILPIALAVAAVSLVYILLVKSEPFFITFSNFLFFAGMVVLTIGAFLEFFMRGRSPAIGKSLLIPVDFIFKSAALAEVDRDNVKQAEGEPSGGWMLIYAGASMVGISLLSAFISLK